MLQVQCVCMHTHAPLGSPVSFSQAEKASSTWPRVRSAGWFRHPVSTSMALPTAAWSSAMNARRRSGRRAILSLSASCSQASTHLSSAGAGALASALVPGRLPDGWAWWDGRGGCQHTRQQHASLQRLAQPCPLLSSCHKAVVQRPFPHLGQHSEQLQHAGHGRLRRQRCKLGHQPPQHPAAAVAVGPGGGRAVCRQRRHGQAQLGAHGRRSARKLGDQGKQRLPQLRHSFRWQLLIVPLYLQHTQAASRGGPAVSEQQPARLTACALPCSCTAWDAPCRGSLGADRGSCATHEQTRPDRNSATHLGLQRLRAKVLRFHVAAGVVQHGVAEGPRLGRLLPLLQPPVRLRLAGYVAMVQRSDRVHQIHVSAARARESGWCRTARAGQIAADYVRRMPQPVKRNACMRVRPCACDWAVTAAARCLLGDLVPAGAAGLVSRQSSSSLWGTSSKCSSLTLGSDLMSTDLQGASIGCCQLAQAPRDSDGPSGGAPT